MQAENKPQTENKPQAENKPQTESKPASNNFAETKQTQTLGDDFNIDSILDDLPNDDVSLPQTNSDDELDIFADNNFAPLSSDTNLSKETTIATKNESSLADKADILLNKENPNIKQNLQVSPQSATPKDETIEAKNTISGDELLTDITDDKPASAPKSQLHSYEDALLKIKNALSSDEDISLQNIDVKPVSLGSDDDFPSTSPIANNADSSPAPSAEKAEKTDDDEWEYVDENGNPISADDNGDWEYVDENGNPISADDDGDWEYVDENGNPIENKS